eukprot:TRINITY_DN9545_c0_g1_i1.p2 TRINITY_DN9545_c0_g1~~TRINITY_DN9545_c0_g1_i1.p2  ORF type:complete len:169 (-),score=47.99 TRINITY_DN9545_c0_g1_i1:151-657(-)
MSIVPPMVAAFGGGIPEALINLFPEINPLKALVSAVFLYNTPHMVKMYLTSQAAGGGSKVKNENPRQQYEAIKEDKTYGDALVRAQAAHQNGLESFPVFAAGVLACVATGADKKLVGKLAAFHLAARAGFNVFYICFQTPLAGVMRSNAWVASLLSSCQLLILAANKL